MNEQKIKRILEAIPALSSCLILAGIIGIFFIKPLWSALFLIVYLIYWAYRLLYMTSLLVIAHLRMYRRRNTDWLALCREQKTDIRFDDIYHVVLYPIYKEPERVINESLAALASVEYSKDHIIVVLAGEERDPAIEEKLAAIKKRYKHVFYDIITVIHPADMPGEIPSKGANATYAAKRAKEYLDGKKFTLEHILISCFDVDTCPDKNYFACLAYHFLTNPNRYQTSYQPLPIYSNNIYKAPALARVIEIGSTFWQLIESMRYDKFITFSSHSMSFKTLVGVGYWPVDMVSDDSVIFWKCFLYFNGVYQTFPLETPVFMDIAVGKNALDTICIQYTQKRRWAWGVENFVYITMNFLTHKKIKRSVKIQKSVQLLLNHVNWATWALIISFITPSIIFWGKKADPNDLILFNLSYINGIISHALFLIIFLSIIMSKYFIPRRPKNVSRMIYVSFIFQWMLLPLISAVLGSFPALDAQIRLMCGKYLVFNRTPKTRQ